MKFLISLAITLLLFSTAIAQNTDQFGYPDFSEMVSRTFGKYSMAGLKGDELPRLEKRPDGWYLAVISYDKTGYAIVKQHYMLWERASGKHLDLPLPVVADPGEGEDYFRYYLNESKIWQFKMVPYCGYAGWDTDIINEFGPEEDSLPDAYLYGLGRAYAAYAGDLLQMQTGFAPADRRFVLPPGRDAMSSTQLSIYREFRHKAIECYEKLAKRNPAFETVVGGITLSRDNEYLTSYCDLLTFMNKEEALKELPDGLYDNFYREYARTVLTACDSNAILFTLGDNDLYSLLYAQEKLGIRRDVLIINQGLLQSERYISSLMHLEGPAESIKLSFDDRQLWQLRKEVIRFNSTNDVYLISSLMLFLKETLKDANMKDRPEDLFTVNADMFWVEIGRDTLEVKMMKGYAYLNQLILLDILVNEKLSRPVYFSAVNDEIRDLGLGPYIENQAFVYKLNAKKGEGSPGYESLYGSVNLEKVAQHYLSLNWGAFTDMLPEEEGQVVYYVYNLSHFALSLLAENKDSTVLKLTDHMLNSIPKEGSLVKDLAFQPFILLYYAMGQFEKGNRLAEEIAANIKSGHENYSFGLLTPEYRKQAIEKVISSAKELNQKDIVKLYNRL